MRRLVVGCLFALAMAGCHREAERTGVTFRDDKPLTLLGPELSEGNVAPAFELVSPTSEPIRSADFAGKTLIVSVVPSLDTPVCEAQTGRLASEELKFPKDTVLLTISRDTPHAQRRFLEDNRVTTKLASDFRDGSFGRAWGLLIKETGFLARSVWVIDPSGKVVYREVVQQQGTPPNYDALLKAVAQLPGK